MGFYIETSRSVGKAAEIVKEYGAKEVILDEAVHAYDKGEGVVCVVKNPMFEAAGFCFSARELEDFANPYDLRPKTWLVMDRAKAEKLSGYRREPDAA